MVGLITRVHMQPCCAVDSGQGLRAITCYYYGDEAVAVVDLEVWGDIRDIRRNLSPNVNEYCSGPGPSGS